MQARSVSELNMDGDCSGSNAGKCVSGTVCYNLSKCREYTHLFDVLQFYRPLVEPSLLARIPQVK